MAAAIRERPTASKTPLDRPLRPGPPPAIELDTAQLDQIIGAKGQANGGIYQFDVPRREPVKEDDMVMAPVGPMGVAIAHQFPADRRRQGRDHRRFRADRR